MDVLKQQIVDLERRFQEGGDKRMDASWYRSANTSTSQSRNPEAPEMRSSMIKVPTFDGEVPWEIYKSQFEVAVTFNG